VSVQKAIGDLSTEKKTRMSKFVLEINKRFGKHLPPADMSHYEIRGNEDRVRRRFRIYQVQAAMTNKMAAKEISSFLAGRIETLSDVAWNEIRKFKFLTLDNKMALFRDKEEFEKYLSLHLTKKQTQKALVADQPAPAALSIPDDFCHYADLRTLTAREMARIQTFPDNFVFRSKRTTGGQSRRFEVPVFTQIGNAVPVQLGYALGECIVTLLNKAKSRA
jgi:DNA (cytosine-5)-methyltransferase 1